MMIKRMSARHCALFVLAAVAALLFLPATPAYAATDIIVDTTEDEQTDNGNCSFVEAIATAYGGIQVDNCTDPSGGAPYTITFAVSGAISVNYGFSLPINTAVTIDGAGQSIALDGGGASPILAVEPTGNLTVNNLIIQNGAEVSDIASIYNQGVLTIADSTIRNHTGTSYAGGVLNRGTMTVTRSIIQNNDGPVGGIFNWDHSRLTLADSIVRDNDGTATGGIGGVLTLFQGTLAITNTTFYSNSGALAGSVGNFGGIVSINNSTFSSNSSATATIYSTFGCFSEEVSLLLADGSTKSMAEVAVGDRVRSFDFTSGRPVIRTVTDVMQRQAPRYLRVNGLEVTPEHPFAVGEDEWKMAGLLQIGDRILSLDGWTTVTTIERVDQPIQVFNITVEGTENYYVTDGRHTYLVHNKLAQTNFGDNTITNSIITNSSVADCVLDDGTFLGSNNLIDDYALGACSGISSAAVTNIATAPADNGGSTATIALLPGSNAIDTGDDTTCATTDQRGVTRPQGSTCDIGAYEFDEFTLTAALDGTGSGTVTSDPAGISCGSDCAESWRVSTVVTLTATADSGSVFTGWSGEVASSTNPLTVTLAANTAITATFAACPFPRNVGTTDELNSAITCYNGQSTPGAYTITLTNDITLTADLIAIDNATTGVELVIDGDGYIVNGDGQSYTTFVVEAGTVVTMAAIAVTQSSGAGIQNNAGTLTVTKSTIFGNGESGLRSTGAMTVTNSTISGNAADQGGGIYAADRAQLILINVTITDNEATSGDGSGIYSAIPIVDVTAPGSITLINTIIADQRSGSDCANVEGDDGKAAFVSGGHNLDSDDTCNLTQGSDLPGNPDADLGPLQNNGGPTATHALSLSSAALDAGDTAVCTASPVGSVDQREVARPQGPDCDIGAYEREESGDITFVKVVDGGSAQPADWTFDVDGGPTGIAHNATETINTGVYTVTESGPSDYALTGAGGACSLSGDTVSLDVTTAGGTCTITNTRQTGDITFVKVVDGGDASPSAWTFDVSDGGPTGIAHNATETINTGTYTVTESGPSGYALTGAGGACSLSGDTVSLDVTTAGGTCTITNTITVTPVVSLTESYGVTSVTEGQLSGEGSTACHWVTLNVQPSDPVTVTVAAQQGYVSVDPAAVVLTGANWNNLTLTNRSNFVCVRAVNDSIDQHAATQTCKDRQADLTGQSGVPSGQECGDRVDYLSHTVTSVNPAYDGLTAFTSNSLQDLDSNPATVDVLVRDDDTAGVVLTESHGVTDLDEDGTLVNLACYWVTLTSQPSADVTVTPQTDGRVTVQPASVVLNALTWNSLGAMSNRVCVTPVQNDTVDGSPNAVCAPKKADIYGSGADDGQVCGSRLSHVTHAIGSSDAAYNGPGVPVSGNGPNLDGNPRTLDVLLRDDDAAGLVFAPAVLSGVEGGTVSYQVRLATQPQADVTVRAGTIQAAGVGATVLTFTPATWNVPQEVSLTLPNDDLANGVRVFDLPHTVASADPAYAGLSGAATALPATVSDDDALSAHLSTGAVTLIEGGATTGYTLRLSAKPVTPVTIRVEAGALVRTDPTQLTFTPENWAQPQPVTVTAVDDDVDRGGILDIVIQHVSNDTGLAVASVRVVLADNDTAALTVGQAATPTLAEGASTTYPVTLATRPLDSVQVSVVTDGKTAAAPTTLTFTPENWTVPQMVTLTAVDDAVDSPVDVRTSPVNHAARSGDDRYDGLVVEGLSVDVIDNDVAALLFSTNRVDLTQSDQATYSVALATQPTALVLITLAPSAGVAVDATCVVQAEGVDACLLFTPGTWTVPQTVTVTGTAGRIDHRAASTDAAYDARSVRVRRRRRQPGGFPTAGGALMRG